jgi:hypothetical protein
MAPLKVIPIPCAEYVGIEYRGILLGVGIAGAYASLSRLVRLRTGQQQGRVDVLFEAASFLLVYVRAH